MNYGLDIGSKKDLVGICYSTWFNPIVKYGGEKPKNIAEILAGKDTWGAVGQFHFWSEPALGYYRSDDRKIIRRHMELLQARESTLLFWTIRMRLRAGIRAFPAIIGTRWCGSRRRLF